MKKANKELRNYLFKCFPYVFEIDLDEKQENELEEYYCSFAISIFDHWLTETEADDFLSNYLWHGSYQNSLDEYKTSENGYLSFFKELNELEDIYIFQENIPNEIGFEQEGFFGKIESFEELKNICLSSIREEDLCTLCLPRSQIVIQGGYDMTQIVYFKEESKIDDFYNLLEKFKLYVLSRN